MSVMEVRPAISRDELIGLVDGVRGFVVDRMYGYRSEVDAVMQKIRETVWRCENRYDPLRGRPEEFVFGIARNVVRREIAALGRRPLDVALIEPLVATIPARVSDPLTMLVGRFEQHRWIQILADAVTETEWQVVIDLALTDTDHDTVADRFGLTPRTVRAIRERVTLIASTVRAALVLADRGVPVSSNQLTRCVPSQGGLRQALEFLDIDAHTAATELGLAVGSFRNRRALATRLLRVAVDVIEHEQITC